MGNADCGTRAQQAKALEPMGNEGKAAEMEKLSDSDLVLRAASLLRSIYSAQLIGGSKHLDRAKAGLKRADELTAIAERLRDREDADERIRQSNGPANRLNAIADHLEGVVSPGIDHFMIELRQIAAGMDREATEAPKCKFDRLYEKAAVAEGWKPGAKIPGETR